MLIVSGDTPDNIYNSAVRTMAQVGVRSNSRNGPVIAAPCPVVTVNTSPTRRVLFNRYRDANPFFHLVEALWMLGGRNETDVLDVFVKDFGARYAEKDENGKSLGYVWGAYGHRWRKHFGFDQLGDVIQSLRSNPDDRRVVIQMWDTNIDVDSELITESRKPALDVPCNTQIYPRIVNGALDITVTCRSNDVVWGCYGANLVHFSVLLEYLAAGIGVPVGRMYQLSNNWHLYDATASKFREDVDAASKPYPDVLPLVDNFDSFDDEVEFFLDSGLHVAPDSRNRFLLDVVGKMVLVHQMYRDGDHARATQAAEDIAASDWRRAVQDWLLRRTEL